MIHYLQSNQGVWIRREVKLTWPALLYDYIYTCLADGTPFVQEIFRIGYYIRQKFLNQIKYRLLSMYILYMVGRAASVVSPFYFILLDSNTWSKFIMHSLKTILADFMQQRQRKYSSEFNRFYDLKTSIC